MTKGLPDWSKASVVYPLLTSFLWNYEGNGNFTTIQHGTKGGITNDFEKGLGGKEVHIYSFSANGYMVETRDVTYTQTYHGNILYQLLLYDVEGNVRGGVTELQTPVTIDNVDKIRVQVILPADCFASSADPSYYEYAFVFHVSYKIIR